MARGKNWSREEDEALKDVKERFPGLGYTALARVCKGLYVCEGRSEQAIRDRYKRLYAKPVCSETPEQITMDEAWVSDGDMYVMAKKYESLLNVIFDNATLWTGAFEDGLFFNIPTLRAWLKKNEMERFDARLNELLNAPRPTYIKKEYTTTFGRK